MFAVLSGPPETGEVGKRRDVRRETRSPKEPHPCAVGAAEEAGDGPARWKAEAYYEAPMTPEEIEARTARTRKRFPSAWADNDSACVECGGDFGTRRCEKCGDWACSAPCMDEHVVRGCYVECHACSRAGGADRAVYHRAPVCGHTPATTSPLGAPSGVARTASQ